MALPTESLSAPGRGWLSVWAQPEPSGLGRGERRDQRYPRFTFSPSTGCTRAQIVTFLFRASKASANGAPAFSDVAATAYYAEAVKWATDNGITNGIGDNLFGSDNDCTRAQIVTFLYRMYQEN